MGSNQSSHSRRILALEDTGAHGIKLLVSDLASPGTCILGAEATAGRRERTAPAPTTVVPLSHLDTT